MFGETPNTATEIPQQRDAPHWDQGCGRVATEFLNPPQRVGSREALEDHLLA
jgi:hypothetical protein